MTLLQGENEDQGIDKRLETLISETRVFGTNYISPKTERSRKTILPHWRYIIQNIEPIPLLDELAKQHILNKTDFENIRSKSRSHQAYIVLLAASKKIPYETIKNILRKVSIPCGQKLSKPFDGKSPQTIDDQSIVENQTSLLKRHCAELEEALHRTDLLEILDTFVEAGILSLDDVDYIVLEYPKREAAKSFVEKVITNVNIGSVECLEICMKELGICRRFTNIFSDTSHTVGERKKVSVVETEERHTHVRSIVAGDMKITIKAENETNLRSHLTLNPHILEPVLAEYLGAGLNQTSDGSIVLHLKLLDERIRHIVRIEKINECITECLERLYNGIYIEYQGELIDEVHVTLENNQKDACSVLCNSKEIQQQQSNNVNLITVNKAFLIKELDVQNVADAFSKKGIAHFDNIGLNDLERLTKGAKFVSFLEKQNLWRSLLRILEEENMQFVLSRLNKSEKYCFDTLLLKKKILHNMSTIAAELDFTILRNSCTEREVLSESFFSRIEKSFPERDEDLIKVLLTEIMKAGPVAMMTLVDILYTKNVGLSTALLDNTEDNDNVTTTIYKRKTDIAGDHLDRHEKHVLFTGRYRIVSISTGDIRNKALCTNHQEDPNDNPFLKTTEPELTKTCCRRSGAHDSYLAIEHKDDPTRDTCSKNKETGKNKFSVGRSDRDSQYSDTLHSMEGFLQLKLSLLKGYRARWFSFSDNGYLRYYFHKPTRPDQQPNGHMHLLLSEVYTKEDTLFFRIISANNTKYCLKADDFAQREQWINAIETVQQTLYQETFGLLYDNIKSDKYDRTKNATDENQSYQKVSGDYPGYAVSASKGDLGKFKIKRTFLVVAAIDFGTTYSGCAFSTVSDFNADPLRITPVHLDEENRSYKTPTVLLLTPEGNFHSFGNHAQEYYVTLAENDKAKDWYYFDRFKMELCTRESSIALKSNITIKEKGGKLMKACNVFAFSIEHIKDKVLKTLQGAIKHLEENDIKWVLTVPAIWNDQARQFMIHAAEKAGIERQNLSLALEPESAALCCKHIDVAKGKSKQLQTIDKNTSFMVVDMGGGTVDITISHLLPTGQLKQMHSPIGGPWGGNVINDEIMKTLKEVIGLEEMASLIDDDFDSYLKVEKNIELKKRSYRFDLDFKLDIPTNIGKSFIISDEYKDKVQIRKGTIFYSTSLIRQIYMSSINPIIECVDVLLSKNETQDVSTILLVGGYASSTYVQDVFKEKFGQRFDIRIPLTPDMTVLKGAIITGHTSESIAGRVAKYHYGFALRSKDVIGRRVSISKISKKESKKFCPFIKKGQIIKVGDVVSEYEITLEAKAVLAKVDIYTTEEDNPTEEIDNKHFSKVGSINVKIPRLKTESTLLLIVSYDETEFKVVAKDANTKKIFLGFCKFLEKDNEAPLM